MRRASPDTLVPNEERTLLAALALRRLGFERFHGYKLASQLRSMHHTNRAMSYSTLYRCLDRLADRGFVTVVDGEAAGPARGPKRKEFELTESGAGRASDLAAERGADSELFWNLA